MEDEESPKGVKAVFSFYSSYVWGRLVSSSSSSCEPKLNRSAAHERCVACLPLPITPHLPISIRQANRSSGIPHVLERMLDQILLNLRIIEDNLHFWKSREKASNARKLYFIICERGPQAFIDGIARLLSKDPPLQTFSASASFYISERVDLLSRLRPILATFLSQIYMEIERCSDELSRNQDQERSLSLPTLLVAPLNRIFSDLGESIRRIHPDYQNGLHFDNLPVPNQEDVNLTDNEVANVVYLINNNLLRLDSYLSLVVACHQKPKKITQYWIPYTCGAIGLSICSLWLIRHSSVMGSSDVGNWIRAAKDSTYSFFSEHVEPPLLSIRDELFGTSTERHGRLMEREQVQPSSNSLQSEEARGKKLPSDQEMREIVTAGFEKQLRHPIRNLLSGEFFCTLGIQFDRINLDLKTLSSMLDQINKPNKNLSVVLASIPAIFLSYIMLKVVRAGFDIWDTKAQGTGRNALRHRMILLMEIDTQFGHYIRRVNQKQEKESHLMYGLMLYNLDLLSHSVRWHAQKTGEWERLEKDINFFARPSFDNDFKLSMVSGMFNYKCLGYHFT